MADLEAKLRESRKQVKELEQSAVQVTELQQKITTYEAEIAKSHSEASFQQLKDELQGKDSQIAILKEEIENFKRQLELLTAQNILVLS